MEASPVRPKEAEPKTEGGGPDGVCPKKDEVEDVRPRVCTITLPKGGDVPKAGVGVPNPEGKLGWAPKEELPKADAAGVPNPVAELGRALKEELPKAVAAGVLNPVAVLG